MSEWEVEFNKSMQLLDNILTMIEETNKELRERKKEQENFMSHNHLLTGGTTEEN
jgi:hypothetical protein